MTTRQVRSAPGVRSVPDLMNECSSVTCGRVMDAFFGPSQLVKLRRSVSAIRAVHASGGVKTCEMVRILLRQQCYCIRLKGCARVGLDAMRLVVTNVGVLAACRGFEPETR